MLKIGVTERGDAGIDLSWKYNLDKVEFAILITKEITDEFIQEVIKHKDKIIIHATVTGFGRTVVEPCVPKKEWSYRQILKLIEAGFPVEQIVLRVDPVVPTELGIKTAISVLELFKDTGIKRCRFSFMDMYPHVLQRFKQLGKEPPYRTFNAPMPMQLDFIQAISNYSNIYSFESCAEVNVYSKGCISDTDCIILNKDVKLVKRHYSRKGCLCPGNKYELLNSRFRCKHQCIYCYWKDYTTIQR